MTPADSDSDVTSDVDELDADGLDGADAAGDDADGADADGRAEPADKQPGLGAKLPVIALSAAVALLVAAATVAVWFGISWMRASNDDGLAYSGTRDEVDRVARAAIVTMNTLDYRKLDAGLGNWADATTGTLHDEIVKLTDQNKQQLKDAKSVTSAEVRSSAVRELDDRAGKATVIAAIKTTVQTGDKKPVEKYQRIEATLAKTDAGWKLEGLGEVAYVQPQAQTPPPSK
ncbi:MAG: hypothetical protein GEV28_36390 [Actinophytocola sp.]|uniref:hypothetical protein n=1 Tax=Actinophytocola sp. TaxID=1872138 RepID=UPI00132506D0|nr:hypothetical protein [Actinophytocola sp.]MPZ85569.1 hypothetical protein [Actinophytocola sp.]